MDSTAGMGEQMRTLSTRKLGEVEALLERTRAMQGWLEVAQRCGCATRAECALFDAPERGSGDPVLALRLVQVAGSDCRPGLGPGPPPGTREPRRRQGQSVRHVAMVDYASWMSPSATLLIWFQLRSPGLAEDFERLMTEDRDIVRGSLDAISDWRLTRPADVPGQSIGQADYVLIAEIVELERFEQQASEHVQRLADDLAHLVASRGMLVVRPVL